MFFAGFPSACHRYNGCVCVPEISDSIVAIRNLQAWWPACTSACTAVCASLQRLQIFAKVQRETSGALLAGKSREKWRKADGKLISIIKKLSAAKTLGSWVLQRTAERYMEQQRATENGRELQGETENGRELQGATKNDIDGKVKKFIVGSDLFPKQKVESL